MLGRGARECGGPQFAYASKLSRAPAAATGLGSEEVPKAGGGPTALLDFSITPCRCLTALVPHWAHAGPP